MMELAIRACFGMASVLCVALGLVLIECGVPVATTALGAIAFGVSGLALWAVAGGLMWVAL